MQKDTTLEKAKVEMEKLQRPSGAFCAAASEDYSDCWIRDQLYIAKCFYYTGEFEKLLKGIWVVFDILHKHRWKIEEAICASPHMPTQYIHAKYHPETLEETVDDWGHHQLDAIGLFLHTVAHLYSENVKVLRGRDDLELIQLLVFYLLSVRYWENPDNGMWEEDLDLHSSSIGSALAGLLYIKRTQLATVPSSMLSLGAEALDKLLPGESPGKDVDMAQLSLIWPYNIVSNKMAQEILRRVKQKLAQVHGVNRYYGDQYYGSEGGFPGEWPLGFFWLSIIYSQSHSIKDAQYWLDKGMEQATGEGWIPEIYQDGKPNQNTPLVWAHSFAIIAKIMLEELRKKQKAA